MSLYYLRSQIIREGLDGLEHVDALLRLRGLDPEAVHVPAKRVEAFRHGEFKRAVLDATPLPSFASDMPEPFYDIQFQFTVNVDS